MTVVLNELTVELSALVLTVDSKLDTVLLNPDKVCSKVDCLSLIVVICVCVSSGAGVQSVALLPFSSLKFDKIMFCAPDGLSP